MVKMSRKPSFHQQFSILFHFHFGITRIFLLHCHLLMFIGKGLNCANLDSEYSIAIHHFSAFQLFHLFISRSTKCWKSEKKVELCSYTLVLFSFSINHETFFLCFSLLLSTFLPTNKMITYVMLFFVGWTLNSQWYFWLFSSELTFQKSLDQKLVALLGSSFIIIITMNHF